MNNLLPEEEIILARLMPNVQRLQNDSSGSIQWIASLNDQERVVLQHWAAKHAHWLLVAIQRVPAHSRL